MVMVPELAPAPTGENVELMVHVPPAGMVPTQLVLRVNADAPAVTVTELITRGVFPLLVNVVLCVLLVVLVVPFAKARLAGARLTSPCKPVADKAASFHRM